MKVSLLFNQSKLKKFIGTCIDMANLLGHDCIKEHLVNDIGEPGEFYDDLEIRLTPNRSEKYWGKAFVGLYGSTKKQKYKSVYFSPVIYCIQIKNSVYVENMYVQPIDVDLDYFVLPPNYNVVSNYNYVCNRLYVDFGYYWTDLLIGICTELHCRSDKGVLYLSIEVLRAKIIVCDNSINWIGIDDYLCRISDEKKVKWNENMCIVSDKHGHIIHRCSRKNMRKSKFAEVIQETFSVYEHKTKGIYIMGMWVSIK